MAKIMDNSINKCKDEEDSDIDLIKLHKTGKQLYISSSFTKEKCEKSANIAFLVEFNARSMESVCFFIQKDDFLFL